jgi:hypothetical protein
MLPPFIPSADGDVFAVAATSVPRTMTAPAVPVPAAQAPAASALTAAAPKAPVSTAMASTALVGSAVTECHMDCAAGQPHRRCPPNTGEVSLEPMLPVGQPIREVVVACRVHLPTAACTASPRSAALPTALPLAPEQVELL